MELLVWAIIFVVLVILEFATVQLISIWFALGALVTMICTYFFDIPVLGQLAIFIVVSAVLLITTFPVVRKKIKPNVVGTNTELNLGQTATVIEDINCDLGSGRVTLNGVDWSAVPTDRNIVISKGSIVVVKEIQGTRLIVALKETQNV